MNKKLKKMSFFQKMILAITDFRFYPLMLKVDSMATVIGHFIVFMLILTGIMATSFYKLTVDAIDSLLAEYDEKIPHFTFSEGILDVTTREVYKITNDWVVILDTDHNYDENTSLEKYKEYDIYDNRLYINSDMITYESNVEESGKEQSQVPQELIVFEQVSGDLNKEILKQQIIELKESKLSRLVIFISSFVLVFFIYAFSKIFEILLYSIMTSLVATISGIKLNFKNYVKISLYIITLPYILETISMVYLGTITESAFIVSNLLAYVYILYAIRAVKLDAFILIMNNPNKVKKSKDGRTVIGVEELEKNSNKESDENKTNEANEESQEQKKEDDDNTQK